MNEDTFYASIAQNYEYIFPFKKAQLLFVENQLVKDATILDIGCATGALAIALFKRGFRVDGIDLDEALLTLAKTKGLGVNWVHLNMLDVKARYQGANFDCATCFGNTLAHLSPSQRLDFYQQLGDCLKSGACFLGQVVHYDSIVDNQPFQLPIIDNEQVTFYREYPDFCQSKPFIFASSLLDKRQNVEVKNRIQLYPVLKADLEVDLKNSGFERIQCFGSFKETPLLESSFPLIFRCFKC